MHLGSFQNGYELLNIRVFNISTLYEIVFDWEMENLLSLYTTLASFQTVPWSFMDRLYKPTWSSG